MNLPARRKPLALLLSYGFAVFLAGAYAAETRAQAPEPLRVDPALLGLPPIKPAEASAPANTPAPASIPARKTSVEVQPVEATVVDQRPVETAPEASKPSAQEIPERIVTPSAAPTGGTPLPSPVPAPVPAQAPISACLLYTSPSPRDRTRSRMPSSA